MTNKANRSHKSKEEQKRLSKQRKVKVIGDGRFVQRAKRPAKHGKNVKSQILRVDANFADWVRGQAETEGSVTEVTRKLCYSFSWQPIETAPKDGTYLLLAGNSGYITTPLRVEVGRYDAEYRPHSPWVTHSNDPFTDGGDPPLYWMPLPLLQENKTS